MKNLESVLAERLEPDWKDAPLDPAWTEISPAVRAQIESAHGLITERFAFCQDMPLAEFVGLAETLRASGFRPTRVRPWAVHHAERDGYIGAIWTRDSQKWHIDPSLSKADVPVPDAPASKDNTVVVTHPESGRKALFISECFTTRIVELSPPESEAVLGMLVRHIQRPDFTMRWKWRANDIAVWDNRCTQHFAVPDYTDARVMQRIVLAGARPGDGTVPAPQVEVAAG